MAILVITASFLSSDFILDDEVRWLFDNRSRKGLEVIPLIAKYCAWDTVDWLKEMQVRPINGEPVWRDNGIHADYELTNLTKEVAHVVGA